MDHPVTPAVPAFIFARGGSKGVLRKNIRPVAGKPLIAWSIEAARKSRFVTRVIVSTDDEEIAGIARAHGAEVPFMRPAELAGDAAPEWLAWRHALKHFGCSATDGPLDVFLSVPATAPLRLPQDLDRCIETLLGTDADAVVTVRPAARHPSFNMLTLDSCGHARIAMPLHAITRRQDAPTVYDMTTVAYAVDPTFIFRSEGLFDGIVRTIQIPEERALDIDSEWDLKIADLVLRERETP